MPALALRLALILMGVALAAGCGDSERPRLSTSTATPPSGGGVAVEMVAADGVVLNGTLFAAAPDRLVVSLHQFGLDQSSWFPWARELQADGISVLTVEFRGFGASVHTRDIETLRADVDAALGFAGERGYNRVLLLGASMGGAAAIVEAAHAPADVQIDGVVVLSAPAEFGDVHALEEIGLIAAPLLLVAGRDDASALTSLQALTSAGKVPPDRVLVVPEATHGTELLESTTADEVWRAILAFIDLVWPSARRPAG